MWDWKEWLKAALIRAVKTFAQTFASMVVVGASIAEVDWLHTLSVSGVAALLSIMTSLAGLPEVKKKEEEKPPEDEG